MKALHVTACLAALGLLSNTAAAETINFCIEHRGEYEDNGCGEDYWLTDTPRLAHGARFLIREGANTLFDRNLGDGIGAGDHGVGCLGPITVVQRAGYW